MLLFLKLNRRYWDKNTVKAAIAECGGENSTLAEDSDMEDEEVDDVESGADEEV
jgi:hypothetical protein